MPGSLSDVTAIGLHAVTVLPVVDMRGRLDGITVRDKFSGKLVFAAFTDRDPDCTFCRMTYEPRNFTDVMETA